MHCANISMIKETEMFIEKKVSLENKLVKMEVIFMYHHVNQDEFLTSMISCTMHLSKDSNTCMGRIESIKGKLTHILDCNTHDTFCIP
jgi:hypothetical protein